MNWKGWGIENIGVAVVFALVFCSGLSPLFELFNASSVSLKEETLADDEREYLLSEQWYLFGLSGYLVNGSFRAAQGLLTDLKQEGLTVTREITEYFGIALIGNEAFSKRIASAQDVTPFQQIPTNTKGVTIERAPLSDEGTVSSGPDAATYVDMAIMAYNAGKLNFAIYYLQRSLTKAPNVGSTHAFLGFLLKEKGRVELATTHLQKALRLGDEDAVTHDSLAVILSGKGEHESALFHFREALRLAPTDSTVFYNYAVQLVKMERYEEALRYAKQLIANKHKLAPSHNLIGIILAQEGDTEGAIEHFTEALKIDPDFKSAVVNLRLMESENDEGETPVDQLSP